MVALVQGQCGCARTTRVAPAVERWIRLATGQSLGAVAAAPALFADRMKIAIPETSKIAQIEMAKESSDEGLFRRMCVFILRES